MNESDTPRTDGMVAEYDRGWSYADVFEELCRKLERELTAARAEIAAITEQRDRLAHELERITITGSADHCRKIADEALQSLTTNAKIVHPPSENPNTPTPQEND
jgi:hypothetical protein